MTTLLSALALVAIVVAHKLEAFADLPIVRPVVAGAVVVFAFVALVDPDAASVGSAWLIDQYVAEATELSDWMTERLLDSNPILNPSPPETSTP